MQDDQRQPRGAINSIDFHRTHDFLVAGHDGGFISIYNTYMGSKLATLDCSKHGVSHIRYTHHPKCILHASTKVHLPASPLLPFELTDYACACARTVSKPLAQAMPACSRSRTWA